MVFEELRQSEARDRRALENHLKPVIAAPPEFLQSTARACTRTWR
jgi:hypothetical protein